MTQCNPQSLAEVIQTRFGGVLAKGGHYEVEGLACILEAVSVCENKPWTDNPLDLDRPDVRALNDGFAFDMERTDAMLRLAPLLTVWPSWDASARLDYVRRVVIRTVRELLPIALSKYGNEHLARKCKLVSTIEAAHAASLEAVEAKIVFGVAMSTADAAHAVSVFYEYTIAAGYAAKAAASVADACPTFERTRVLNLAVSIWAEEAL